MRRYQLFVGLALALCLAAIPAAAARAQQQDEPVTNAPQGNTEPPAAAVPPTLTFPAGTLITVRTTEFLSSDRNQPGDEFTAILDQPLVAQGWVVAQLGQTVIGRVAIAQKAGRTTGVSQLGLELKELVIVDGQQLPIQTQLVQTSAGTSRAQDAAVVASTTGIGAAIGAAAGGGEGAAIGAAAGAAAGVVGVLSTRGRATELPPETVLTFRLTNPVVINTQQSQQAFRPVEPEDYPGNAPPNAPPETYRPRVYVAPPGYYYPPYTGYYPYYGYYGYYPPVAGPYFGFYGFGFGGRGFVGHGGFVGRGFGRRR